MTIIPKRLTFRLYFRAKTNTPKIVSRELKLLRLLNINVKKTSAPHFFIRESLYGNSFCYNKASFICSSDLLKVKKKGKQAFFIFEKNVRKLNINVYKRFYYGNRKVQCGIGNFKVTKYWFIANKGINGGTVDVKNCLFSKSKHGSCILQTPSFYCPKNIWPKIQHKYTEDTPFTRYNFVKKKNILNYLKKKENDFTLMKETLLFGRYGICFTKYGIIKSKFVETAKLDISKILRKKGRVWTRICCDVPATQRPDETRMGKGKGSISDWVAKVYPGQLFFEFSGINKTQLTEIYKKLCQKSAITLKIIY